MIQIPYNNITHAKKKADELKKKYIGVKVVKVEEKILYIPQVICMRSLKNKINELEERIKSNRKAIAELDEMFYKFRR